MRLLLKVLLFVLIISCNQNDSTKTSNKTELKRNDSVISHPPSHRDSILSKQNLGINSNDSAITRIQNHTDSIRNKPNKKELIVLSAKILRSLKERDYPGLMEFVHPNLGVRFSPYAFVDTKTDQLLSKKSIVGLGKSQKRIKWGLEDGSGDQIKLSINDYIKKFVYDVDFLNAEKKAVNEFLGSGNSLNNLKEAYPGCDFTEFYFSGFDPKFDGMDWRTLRLVFKKYKKRSYLIAIVHDEWTI